MTGPEVSLSLANSTDEMSTGALKICLGAPMVSKQIGHSNSLSRVGVDGVGEVLSNPSISQLGTCGPFPLT